MSEYMLDSSAIGEIDKGEVSASDLHSSDDDFYITHIQEDEIEAAGSYTPVLERALDVLDADSLPTHGFYSGVSKSGRAAAGSGANSIARELSDDDGNETRDAIIAKTAVHHEFILVTDDSELREVVNEVTEGKAISIDEFNSRV
jgi:predicted nucleic acid-binding protein